MPAVSTMILNSLIMTGEKPIEVTSFTQSETTYHLSRLNSMMDSWSQDRLMIPYLSQTSFALTAGLGVYTIGSGGNFNMTRPMRLVDPCFIRDTDDIDLPVELIDADTYGRILNKSFGDDTPAYMFYDSGYSATSTATIRLYPVPSSGLTLFINTLQPLQGFSTVTVTLSLPAGYQDAIEANYAIRSALGVIPVSNDLKEMARTTKAAIRGLNSPAPIMRLDYGVNNAAGSNIFSGP